MLTKGLLKCILIPTKVLSLFLLINFLVNMYIIFSGFYPSRTFSDISNLHNLLLIPFFFSCMYTYKVFVSITGTIAQKTNHTIKGNLIFFTFVVCKVSLGMINILIGKSKKRIFKY